MPPPHRRPYAGRRRQSAGGQGRHGGPAAGAAPPRDASGRGAVGAGPWSSRRVRAWAAGAFMAFYDASTRTTVAYATWRETAPMGARPDMFMGADGKPLNFRDAVVSAASPSAYLAPTPCSPWRAGRARASGVEHVVRFGRDLGRPGLRGQPAHGRHDRQPPVSAERASRRDRLFHPRRRQEVSGKDRLPKNAAYANTLRALAAKGVDALYEGPIFAHILAKTHADPLAGTMTEADLKAYRAKEGPALCRPYRVYSIVRASGLRRAAARACSKRSAS